MLIYNNLIIIILHNNNFQTFIINSVLRILLINKLKREADIIQ